MPIKIEDRTHGDSHLVVSKNEYFELTNEEYDYYIELLRTIVTRLHLNAYTLIDAAQPAELRSTILALKQKYEIAYSNGCPWPMKATIDRIASERSKHLAIDKDYVVTLKDIKEMVVEGRNEDGRASFLFQLLLESVNESLTQELLSFQPWERLEEQEDENLPERITREENPLSYGLANDLPYFQVIKPLLGFIYDGNKNVIIRDRYQRVLEFFETKLDSVQTIEQLIKVTKGFVDSQFTLVVTYECNHSQAPHSFETFQTTVYSSILPCSNHPEQPAYASQARARN